MYDRTMGSSPAEEHETAAGDVDSAVPAPAASRGVTGSPAQLARLLAYGEPNTRATVARTVQASAGNRAVQLLATRARTLQRWRQTNNDGNWQVQTTGNGRLSENGETLTFSSQEAYATPTLIEEAGGKLAIRDSSVVLYAMDPKKTVVAPDGSGTKTLSRIGVDITSDPQKKKLSGDCREAALDVAGKGPAGGPEALTITEGGKRVDIYGEKGDASDAAVRAMLVDKKIHERADYGSLDEAARQRLIKEAQEPVELMKGSERANVRGTKVSDDRAKDLGIDAYANPGIGDAYVAVAAPIPGQNEFHFHFAAVIMAPGEDRVTLENMGESQGVRNDKWFMDTYSVTDPRWNFHEMHSGVTQGGHTFVVRTGPPSPADSAALIRMNTPDLIRRFLASSNVDEKAYIQHLLMKRNVSIDVAVDHTEDDDQDEVYAIVETDGNKTRSPGFPYYIVLKSGEKASITVPVKNIWPPSKEMVVSIFEHDALSPDDLIGTIKWASPFELKENIPISAGTARYRVGLFIW